MYSFSQRGIASRIAKNELLKKGQRRIFSKGRSGIIRRRPRWIGITSDFYATSYFAHVWNLTFIKVIHTQQRKKKLSKESH